MTTTFTARLATIACTLLVSATMLFGALAPATSIGTDAVPPVVRIA